MSVLCDKDIISLCTNQLHPMIYPFSSVGVREENGKKIISYGVSAYGYDIRVANEFKHIDLPMRGIIDPKQRNDYFTEQYVEDYTLVAPNSMVLCRSVEYFHIPRDIMCIAVGKSTYARCGIVANITPLEAEWEGYLTIELSNTTPLPVKVYANEGIAQLIFFKAKSVCATSYKDKNGKYQGQLGVTEARL